MGKTGRPTDRDVAAGVGGAAALDWSDWGRAFVCGSVRRLRPTVSDVDLLLVTDLPDLSVCRPDGWHVTPKTANRWLDGVWCELWWCPEQSEGPMLQFLTGPYDLNVWLRQRAQKRGFKLSQYGLFVGDRRLDVNTEESVFVALDVPYMVPEERDGWKEIVGA